MVTPVAFALVTAVAFTVAAVPRRGGLRVARWHAIAPRHSSVPPRSRVTRPAAAPARRSYRGRRPPDRETSTAGTRTVRRIVLVLAAVAGTLLVPAAMPLVLVAAWLLPRARHRRARRRRDRVIAVELPEVADLLAMAVDAGLTIGDALAVVGSGLSGPLAAAMSAIGRDVAVGRRLADALELAAARAGPAGRPLFLLLADGARSGAPVAEALHRIAGEGRESRRRGAEEAARRLPVKLLFPLVGCVLPAFALLTVVPVVAGAVRSLRH